LGYTVDEMATPADDGGLTAHTYPIDFAGAATPDRDVQVEVVTLAETKNETVKLKAPRGSIAVGDHFLLRYRREDGAWRGLCRCRDSRPVPGMRDELIAILLADAAPAQTRTARRTDVRVSARVKVESGRSFGCDITSVSANGIRFSVPDIDLAPGTSVQFEAAGIESNPYSLVRRAHDDPTVYAATTQDAEDGKRVRDALIADDLRTRLGRARTG
jgi:hypothetical protein